MCVCAVVQPVYMEVINESHMLYVCVCVAVQPVYMEVINESHMLYVCVCCTAGVHGSYQ